MQNKVFIYFFIWIWVAGTARTTSRRFSPVAGAYGDLCCDFKRIDFEADLASMYTEVRMCMARNYAFDFGPEKVSAPERDIKDMGKEEYDKYIKQTDAQMHP